MRGEFIGVWSETWRDIWIPLADREDTPNDLFCELYRELAKALKAQPTIESLADIIDGPLQSKQSFESTRTDGLVGELGLITFLENVHAALDDLAGDVLANRYLICLRPSSTSSAYAMICGALACFVPHCRACSPA
jgi:hypothetical protein